MLPIVSSPDLKSSRLAEPPRSGEVQVLLLDLDLSAPTPDWAMHHLSDEEQARAARFRSEPDRIRFALCRAWLRRLLAAYLEASPRSLAFAAEPWGKPVLPSSPFDFNLSHSGALGAIAISRSGPIGIDLEQIRALHDLEGVTDRFFAPEEQELIRNAPPEQRPALFFECWTRKEAMLKALGTGLSLSPEKIHTSLGPDQQARLLSIDGDTQRAAPWTLHPFLPHPDYRGCLATAANTSIHAGRLAANWP